jgi:hypothetical protein
VISSGVVRDTAKKLQQSLRYGAGVGRRVGFVAVAVLLCTATGGVSRARASSPPFSVYSGLGSWLDIFAGSAWSKPEALVAHASAEGVQTLYLQTSNYSQAADIVHPLALGRFIDAAHAAGLSVVAWYLPGFTNTRLDARRVRAAVDFRTKSGQRFDGFAQDIEASVVGNVAERNARLLSLGRLLKRMVPAGYPLGAIIPSPVGMRRHPHYWPDFPYAGLARLFHAFLPMAYFSYYTHSPQAAYAYAQQVMTLLRTRIGHRNAVIHMIGGSAKTIPTPTLAAFVRAVSDCAAAGISLYAFPQTSTAEWSVLSTASLGGVVSASCTE